MRGKESEKRVVNVCQAWVSLNADIKVLGGGRSGSRALGAGEFPSSRKGSQDGAVSASAH